MKLEVNEKDHVKYQEVNNAQVDVDRQTAILFTYYQTLLSNIEETKGVIHKTSVESGKEAKEADLRELIHQTKQEARLSDKLCRDSMKESKRVFDKMTAASEDQRQLKKEVQFLRGVGGQSSGAFINKAQMKQLTERMLEDKKHSSNDPKTHMLN